MGIELGSSTVVQWFDGISSLGLLLCILLIFPPPLGHKMAAIVPSITLSTIIYKGRKEIYVCIFTSYTSVLIRLENVSQNSPTDFPLHLIGQNRVTHPPPPSCPNPVTNKGKWDSHDCLRLTMIHPLEGLQLPSVTNPETTLRFR